MKVIQKLLEGVPSQDLQNYESHIQLHLKQIMTTINKHILEDTTQANIRKYRCYIGCYDYFIQQDSVKQNDKALLLERVNELRTCKQKCGAQMKQISKFLDNINFYSKRKITGCSQDCYKMTNEEEQNTCLWECHNRLDRRYKQYWKNQRIDLEAKYKI